VFDCWPYAECNCHFRLEGCRNQKVVLRFHAREGRPGGVSLLYANPDFRATPRARVVAGGGRSACPWTDGCTQTRRAEQQTSRLATRRGPRFWVSMTSELLASHS
jgi:hypothetical protein